MSTSTPATCVFCGRVIAPDEAASGRPPAAAHASCADAALADDRHWDAIARASGEPVVPEQSAADQPERPVSDRPQRQGCLTLLLAAVIIGLAAGGLASAGRRAVPARSHSAGC